MSPEELQILIAAADSEVADYSKALEGINQAKQDKIQRLLRQNEQQREQYLLDFERQLQEESDREFAAAIAEIQKIIPGFQEP